MAKYLVETYYTCSFKVSHYLDDINEENLNNLEKKEDGKFEVIDVKLDNRKTKNLQNAKNGKVEIVSLRGETAFLSGIRATPEHTFGLVLSLFLVLMTNETM